MNYTRRTQNILSCLCSAVALLFPTVIVNAQTRPHMGLVAPKKEDFSFYPLLRKRTTISNSTPPTKFTLEDKLPPIGNQEQTASCVGWSTAYYCYSMSVADNRRLNGEERSNTTFLFSPGYIWNQYNGGNSEEGMQIFQAFDVLAKMGCATLDVFPWVPRAIPWAPDEAAKVKAQRYVAAKTYVLFKGKQFGDAPNPEAIRQWLWTQKTPVVFGIPIYADFPMQAVSDDLVYDLSSTNQPRYGLHAITLVGYDQSKQAFLMVNSWGEGWGNHGKLWLSERFVTEFGFQGCVVTPGGPSARQRMPQFRVIPAKKQK